MQPSSCLIIHQHEPPASGYQEFALFRTRLAEWVAAALSDLIAERAIADVDYPPVEIADPKNPEHGDFASNIAMVATKIAGVPPRPLAEAIAAKLMARGEGFLAEATVAGPGFLNFRLTPDAFGEGVSRALELGDKLPMTRVAEPKRINVEFVSVNPNGPITVGSGRGAAYGDTLCRVLESVGHQVFREFYVNDGVNSEQMRLFAESVRSYALSLPFPEKGYRGEYVKDVATAITPRPDADIAWWQEQAQAMMIARQKGDLAAFGVQFDTWFSEQSLINGGAVEAALDRLVALGIADEEPVQNVLIRKKGEPDRWERIEQPTEEFDDEHDGEPAAAVDGSGKTLWLRSTRFGDDKDRVLRRRDGRTTYIASDLAYHLSKLTGRPGFEEGFDQLVDIWGPDHHGYVPRMRAAMAALLLPDHDDRRAPTDDEIAQAMEEGRKRFDVVIFQIVRFMKDGQPAPMRKRDGNIYELRDLYLELGKAMAPEAAAEEQRAIGVDVARFFYLVRSHDTHMDFDIDLATKQSDENPVFYAQYAHARICSVLRKAAEAGFVVQPVEAGFDDPREQALIKKVMDLPHEVARCAADGGVHRLTTYAVELARAYHHFYDGCRVIQPEHPKLTQRRLALCEAARWGLRGVFALLGIRAPERMSRD